MLLRVKKPCEYVKDKVNKYIMNTELSTYRKEKVFWVLGGFFLACMALLNIVGLTKFVSVFGLSVAVGVLPYPLTFLCTDLISEIYGRRRANFLVFFGLVINIFILFFLWLGNTLDAVAPSMRPPWQNLELAKGIVLPNGTVALGDIEFFSLIFATTSGAIFASMVAYMLAQVCDVYVFHYLKRLTKDKHMWLRNNVSTLTSQFIDTFSVVGITFGAVYLNGQMSFDVLLGIFWSNYLFKFFAAIFDTPFFYLFTHLIKRYIGDRHEV